MSALRQTLIASLLPASGFLLCFGLAAQATTLVRLPIDSPTQVSGMTVACTGIGDREEHEARWGTYPVKLESVGAYGQYLGDEVLSLHKPDGPRIMQVECRGPWMMLRLKPGHYVGTLIAPGTPVHHIAFTAPQRGQRDVIVRFQSKTEGREHSSSQYGSS